MVKVKASKRELDVDFNDIKKLPSPAVLWQFFKSRHKEGKSTYVVKVLDFEKCDTNLKTKGSACVHSGEPINEKICKNNGSNARKQLTR